VQNHEFNIGRASWYGDYYDPTTFLDVFKSASENNYSAWRVPEYDAILKKAEMEIDPARRFKILAQAENMLLEEAPILPLYQYVGHYLFRANVHGIPLDPRQMIMLQAVKVEPK
jgi:oligopeptide transport system substrate-binding protein